MKTFQQFCKEAYILREFNLNNIANNPLLKNTTRALNFIDALNPKNNPLTRAAAAYGVFRPYSPVTYAPTIFNQGRSGSLVDKTAGVIPGMRPDPKRDVGRRLGTRLSNTIIPPTASGRIKVGTDRNGKPIYMDK